MNPDLRVELRTRNNRLWHVIHDRAETVAAFCRLYGFAETEIGGFLNLTRSPYMSGGQPRSLAVKVAGLALMLVEDLFPKDLYVVGFPRILSAEIPSDRFRALSAARRVALPAAQEDDLLRGEMVNAIAATIATLTPREAMVIQMRYGLDDGEEHAIQDVARKLGVTRGRVGQIEAKALRKLRHPLRSRSLRPYLDGYVVPVVEQEHEEL